jgi:phospholipid transport system substrate-binding protein
MTTGHSTYRLTIATSLGCLLLLASTALTSPARADGDASSFVAELGRQGIHLMKDASLSAEDRQQRFGALMKEDFDLPKIARIVLGRYWQGTSDLERQQFSDAFADYTVRMYSARFADYGADSFCVIKERARGATTTVVSTQITPVATGQPIDLDWSVESTAGHYKVTDISAGGASLALAQREEFASAVQHSGGSVSSLIQKLRTKTTELATSAH